MPITFRDFLTFPFNDGQGIRANQVDGFTGVNYLFDLTYNSNNNRYEGTFTPAIASAAIGSLVAFETPDTIPNNNMAAICSLPVGAVDTDFAILDASLAAITNAALTPSTLYWGRIYAGLSFVVISSTASGSITRRVVRSVSNIELKALDTTYIELVPAPGAGKYIEVGQSWIQRSGSDRLPSSTSRSILAVSPNIVITEAEALAGNSTPFGNRALDIPDFSTPHYLFFGVNVLSPPIGIFENMNFSDWETVAGTVEVDGITMKWIRTTAAYANLAAVGATTVRGFSDTSRAYAAHVSQYSYLAVAFNPSALLTFPLSAGEYDFTTGTGLDDFLRDSEATPVFAESVSGHRLRENIPLLFGAIIGQPRTRRSSSYSAEGWAEYLNGIDDIAIDVRVQYQIHEI